MQNKIEEGCMQQLRTRLNYIERGGQVQRMHMIPTLMPQNVAAHSFGVAWWCWLLSHDNQPSANLLLAALGHDLPEGVTGDIPAPTKYMLELGDKLQQAEVAADMAGGIPLFELTEAEALILRLADNFELLQHCVREHCMGNNCRQLSEMMENVINYVKPLLKTNLHTRVLDTLITQWASA